MGGDGVRGQSRAIVGDRAESGAVVGGDGVRGQSRAIVGDIGLERRVGL